MSFKRMKEDFICGHCGDHTEGSGYTNHCPKCLWSKHVDIEPGDRAADCGGMMEPVSVEREGERWVLTHRCVKCGHTKRNEMAADDDFTTAVALSQRRAEPQNL